jgi:hypothetical protein
MLGANETVITAWDVVRSRDKDVVHHALIVGYAPFDCPSVDLASLCAMESRDVQCGFYELTDEVRFYV